VLMGLCDGRCASFNCLATGVCGRNHYGVRIYVLVGLRIFGGEWS
jgi:hypothetical protein